MTNCSLIKLVLNKNFITGVGLPSISEAIKNNKTLEEINIAENDISDIGIPKLAEVLENNYIYI